MKKRYRLFRRGRVFWIQDNQTGKQETLRTRDRPTADRLLHARNEAHLQPIINMQIARAYLMVGDPQAARRTWQDVMEEIVKLKRGETQRRWRVATLDRAFAALRTLPILETRAEQFLRTIEKGGVATNVYLRRIHNFALAMSWLPVPIIPPRQWPNVRFKEKRAITLDEHRRIMEREANPERRHFYELAWHLGASQSDIAYLDADNIDWDQRVLSYARKKTGEIAFVRFGADIETVLRRLPATGPLFPYLRTVRAGDRATEFKQRCQGLGIEGVSLHSYRYAWAERARKSGYPERFAQEALGHNSKAVHRAYARRAKVIVPPLDAFEKPEPAIPTILFTPENRLREG
jgi:integrase